MAKQYKSLHPTKYYRDYLANEIRPDGRELLKFRPVIINVGSISTCDGSAVVKVGKTSVVCGIKAELCAPRAERPEEGYLVPNIDLPPLCSPKFKPGPPSDQAQISTKILADIVQNAGCIDLKDLCIAREQLVWCLHADIICLDCDGAIVDACLLALIAALKSLTLPLVEFDKELKTKTVSVSKTKPLTVQSTPVSTTFAVFENSIILTDPTQEEESLCTGMITVVVKDDELCSVLKPGGSPLHDDDLSQCIKIAKNRASLLNKLIETALIESNDE